MTHLQDIYRIITDPAERIVAGDEFKCIGLTDDWWAPCELFVGHRLRDLARSHVEVRRLICHEVVVTAA